MSDPGTAMTISCAFATSMRTPEHIVAAERLGYRRAWCYDSPALYPDVWVVLAMAAERTGTIGLGPGVLVPSLRHPMTNAAAVATLAALAPGRVAVAVGAGFTGRMVLGQRPLRWADVADYIRVLRALLRGESAQWEGATIRMLQPGGYGAGRPLDVPVLVGADGPKGWPVRRSRSSTTACTSAAGGTGCTPYPAAGRGPRPPMPCRQRSATWPSTRATSSSRTSGTGWPGQPVARPLWAR